MLFPKVNKISVHISTVYHITEEKNYVAHSYVAVVCMIG